MKTFKRITGLVLTVAFLAALALPALAQTSPYNLGPQQPNFYRSDTNQFPFAMTGSPVTLTNVLKLTLRQDKGLSIFVSAHATTNSTAATTLLYDVTANGINYTTFEPIAVTFALNGTNEVVFWTNFPASVVNNLRAIKCTSVNGPAGGVVDSLIYSYSGE
jgi:hypothetical protein